MCATGECHDCSVMADLDVTPAYRPASAPPLAAAVPATFPPQVCVCGGTMALDLMTGAWVCTGCGAKTEGR